MLSQIFTVQSILLVSIFHRGQAGRAITRTSWVDEQNLGVKLWTWNSLGADMTQAARELFEEADADPSVKVVAACQTESNIPLLDYIDESRWILVSHGEHWGFAGGVQSAQMLTVLYRRGSGTSERQPAFVGTRQNWEQPGRGAFKKWITKDYQMPAAGIPGALWADSAIHMNSKTGKGGVSALLDFEETQDFSRTSLALICAHLDSQSEEKRDDDFLKLLIDGTRRKDVIHDRHLLWSHPALLFDTTRQYSQKVDAVVILGDLNYRIRYEGANFNYDLKNDEEMAELIGGNMRSVAAMDDPLNPKGANPKALVLDSPRGFGLECNQPFEKYLPTYKRSDFGACEELNNALKGAEGLTPYTRALVKKCYTGGLEKKWKLKESNKFLQMGWLDRMCWRAVDGSAVDVQLLGDRGWHHLTGSDHVAVSATLNLFHPKNYCSVPKDKGAFSVERMERVPLPKSPAIFGRGERVKISQCAKGYAVHDQEHVNQAVCKEDGSFSDALPKCLRICGPPPDVANAAGLAVSRTSLDPGLEDELEVFNVGSRPLLEGDTIRVSCAAGYAMRSGEPDQLRCDEEGAWTGSGYDPQSPLACSRYCGEPKPPAASRVKFLASWSPNLEFLAGDVVNFACADRKETLLGPSSLTCNADTGDYGAFPECKASCGPSQFQAVQHSTFKTVMPSRVFMPSAQHSTLSWKMPSTEILEGVKLAYSCNEGYALIGKGNRTCLSDGNFDVPAPVCVKTVSISITAMALHDIDNTKRHTAKVKIFPVEAIEHFNKFNGYTEKFKFALPLEKNLDFKMPVTDVMRSFVHVEICNDNLLWVSKCKTLAISQLPTAMATATGLSELLESYDSSQEKGQFKMTVPMNMASSSWFEKAKTSVDLTLELSQ